jgi:hypothetical protein
MLTVVDLCISMAENPGINVAGKKGHLSVVDRESAVDRVRVVDTQLVAGSLPATDQESTSESLTTGGNTAMQRGCNTVRSSQPLMVRIGFCQKQMSLLLALVRI